MIGFSSCQEPFDPSRIGERTDKPENDPESLQTLTLLNIQNDPNFERSYTPLFIDLIDDYNQLDPNDQASGYTLSQLESFLVQRPTNWYEYRDLLINNSDNPTEQAAINLFNSYDN